MNLCESGQGQGLRCHIRQGRRGSQADFNEAFDAQSLGRSTEEQVLSFDPANRGSELPGEKLDEQGTRGRLRIGRGLVPIVDKRLGCLGRNNLEDRQCEVPAQLEGTCNQVGDVASLEDIKVDALGKQGIKLVAEGRYACAQSRRVEGNVNSRNHDEGSAAAVCASALSGICFQSLQSGNASGNGVLGAGQVVVDDLQELTGLFGDRGHVVADLGVTHSELVRTQSSHCVVRASLRIAFDQVVHGRSALEDDLKDLLEGEDLRVGRQRGVFTQRVASVEGVLFKGPIGAQFLGLRVGESRQSNLSELREVEDALGVTEGLGTNAKFGRVRADNRFNREAHGLASMRIRLCPYAASSRRHVLQAHHLALNALAGVDVSGARCASTCAGNRDDLIANAAGRFKDELAADAADALNRDIHDVVELDHAEHAVRPRRDLCLGHLNRTNDTQGVGAIDRLSRVCAQRVLNGCGEPHSVDQRCTQTRQTRGRIGGVDRVEIARNNGESRHILRCLDTHVTQERTRRIDEGIGNLGSGGRRLGRGNAASDREALNHTRKDFALIGEFQLDAHDSTRGRLGELGAASLDLDARTEGRQFAVQEDRVIQVHGVDQALDDGNSLVHCRT